MALIRTLLVAAGLFGLAVGGARASIFDFWERDVKVCASGPPDAAIAACTSRINNIFELGGAKAVAFNNRAQAHMVRREYAPALADLNQSIALNPNSPLAFYNRGVVFNDGLAQPARAVQDFTQAIALKAAAAKPKAKADYPEALNYRGLAHLGLGESDLAVKDFSEVLRLNPKFSLALANRAAAYAALHDYPAALADEDGAIRLDGTVPARWAARCWIKVKLAGKVGPPDLDALRDAQSDCRQALRLDAANVDARNALGAIRLMRNEPSDAVADFQAVLLVDKKNSVALFGRGYARRLIGDTAGGDADMAAARGLAPAAAVDFWEAKIIPNP